jgi:hypothetical protein
LEEESIAILRMTGALYGRRVVREILQQYYPLEEAVQKFVEVYPPEEEESRQLREHPESQSVVVVTKLGIATSVYTTSDPEHLVNELNRMYKEIGVEKENRTVILPLSPSNLVE